MTSFLVNVKRVAGFQRILRDGGLSEFDRTAIEAAYRFHCKKTYWPMLAVLSLAIYYGSAFAIWGLAIGTSLKWTALWGISLGLAIAFTICLAPICMELKTDQQQQDRQLFVGMWTMPAIAIGLIGFAVWVIRRILFYL